MQTHPILRRARKSARAGFSLAELMVVIVIIGMLSALVVPNLMAKFGGAQIKTAQVDINTIKQALDSYAINNGGRYPDNLDVLVTPDKNGYTYLDRRTIPKDPWGNEFMYDPPFAGEPRPRVYSYGKDGAPGGEGDARDLSSWPDEE